MAHDVFISYSSKDKSTADAVCSILEQNKIRCWIAPRDVIPGKNYAACITEAIKTSKIIVIIFSNNSNISGPVTNELEIATKYGLTIISVKIENATPSNEMEYYLGSKHWLDAITPPLELHINKLANSIKGFINDSDNNIQFNESKRNEQIKVQEKERKLDKQEEEKKRAVELARHEEERKIKSKDIKVVQNSNEQSEGEIENPVVSEYIHNKSEKSENAKKVEKKSDSNSKKSSNKKRNIIIVSIAGVLVIAGIIIAVIFNKNGNIKSANIDMSDAKISQSEKQKINESTTNTKPKKVSKFVSDILKPYGSYGNSGDSSDYIKVNPFDPYITIGGKSYEKGFKFKTADVNIFRLDLNKKYTSIKGLIGLDDETDESIELIPKDTYVEIIGDGTRLQTYVLKCGEFASMLELDVTGINILEIRFTGQSGVIGLANMVLDSELNLSSPSDSDFANLSGKYMSDVLKPFYIKHFDKDGEEIKHYDEVKINPTMQMNGISNSNGYQMKPRWNSNVNTLIDFNIGGKIKNISGIIGRDKTSDNGLIDTTVVKVWAGNEKSGLIATGGNYIAEYTISPGFNPQNININVEGIEHLRFEIKSSQDGQVINFTNLKMQ